MIPTKGHILRPKFVLMENVVDLVKFAKGHLGRYAFRRLVTLNYQAQLTIISLLQSCAVENAWFPLDTLVTVVYFIVIVSISFYYKLIYEMNDLVYFFMSGS